MPLRNGEEISVTKRRKFRICELEMTYNFEVFIHQTEAGAIQRTKCPRMKQAQQTQFRVTPRGGGKRKQKVGFCPKTFCYFYIIFPQKCQESLDHNFFYIPNKIFVCSFIVVYYMTSQLFLKLTQVVFFKVIHGSH